MKLVYSATTEAEGKMMQEILSNAGIKSVLQLPSGSLSLRLYQGGANIPGEVWELRVNDSDEQAAKDLLPEQQIESSKPKPITQGFAWYVVVGQVFAIVSTLILVYLAVTKN